MNGGKRIPSQPPARTPDGRKNPEYAKWAASDKAKVRIAEWHTANKERVKEHARNYYLRKKAEQNEKLRPTDDTAPILRLHGSENLPSLW